MRLIASVASQLGLQRLLMAHTIVYFSTGVLLRVRNTFFSYFSTKTYVVGTQMNRLIETVHLSTQSICYYWWVRIYLQFYAQLLVSFFTSRQQSFSYKATGLPGLNQYYARINVSCSRTQSSDAGEARTRGPSVSSQALYQ